jgi:benzoate membrane transport protein
MSWCYRQPLAFFWTIPGTVLVGPSLQHLSFPEVIGAFYATSLLILVLGASGWVKRAMQFVPMPIVMGMVAGVFLRFGLDLVRALHSDFAIAVPMCITFLVLSTRPALGRRMPPLIGALLVGAVVVAVLGRIDPSSLGSFRIVRPLVQTPAWSLAAMIELVVPLALTVVVVQNGQGFAVLSNRFTLGALISFLVTVTDLAILNIGAAFWGLIAGFAVSWLLEEHDFLRPPS